jgi:hypothetical protein
VVRGVFLATVTCLALKLLVIYRAVLAQSEKNLLIAKHGDSQMAFKQWARATIPNVSRASSASLFGAVLLASSAALAQAASDAPPPTDEASSAAPAPSAAAAPALPVAAPAPAAAPEPAPPTTASDAMPSTAREEKLPPINVAAWLRMGARIQGARDPKRLNDQSMDTIYGELHAGGKIHKNVSVTLNLNADGLGRTSGIEDAIIGFDVMDEFHVWVGQLLVPVDRANYAGPFFMVPWNYPGVFVAGTNAAFMMPKEGPSGRNSGAVVWGDIAGGSFKYMAGAFDSGDVTQSPLFSGRLNLDVIGKEKGYFGNSTYFGEQDVLSFAVGGQYKKKGSVGQVPAAGDPAPTSNYSEVNADALAEFKLSDSGAWVTGEAAYYHFKGDYQALKNGFYVLAAVASPKVGVGNIQPMVRYQRGTGDNGVKVSTIDAALSYLIMGPALHIVANFQHTDLGSGIEGNALQLGAQAIFF